MSPSEEERSGFEQAWQVLASTIPLQTDEYFLGAWAGKFSDPNVPQGWDGYSPESGLLCLTNHRLIFVAKRTDDQNVQASLQDLPMDRLLADHEERANKDAGPKGNRYVIWESKNLEDIVSFSLTWTSILGGLRLSIRWWHRGHAHNFYFGNLGTLGSFSKDFIWTFGAPRPPEPDPADEHLIIALLSEAMRDRKKEVQEALDRGKGSVVVDFSTLREKLLQQGISLEGIKCPSCGANVELPTAGTKKTCEYCGSRIYAMQVMPKK